MLSAVSFCSQHCTLVRSLGWPRPLYYLFAGWLVAKKRLCAVADRASGRRNYAGIVDTTLCPGNRGVKPFGAFVKAYRAALGPMPLLPMNGASQAKLHQRTDACSPWLTKLTIVRSVHDEHHVCRSRTPVHLPENMRKNIGTADRIIAILLITALDETCPVYILPGAGTRRRAQEIRTKEK